MTLSPRTRVALKLVWLLALVLALITFWNPAERFVYEAF